METFQRVIYGMPLFNESNFEKVRKFIADWAAENGGAVIYEKLANAANEFEIEEICGRCAADCVAELINITEECDDLCGFVVADEDSDDDDTDNIDTDQFIGFGQWFAFDNADAKFRTEEEFVEVLQKYAGILGIDENAIAIYEISHIYDDCADSCE